MKSASSSHSDLINSVTRTSGARATCPDCGQEVQVVPPSAGEHPACPRCGGLLDSVDFPADLDDEPAPHAGHWATGAGLIASLFIHTLLLCAFMVITWQRHDPQKNKEGREVGIVTTDNTPDITNPGVDPIRYEGQWADLSEAVPAGQTDLESLGRPESLSPTLQPGSLVGLPMATGGMSGLEGDFAGLGSIGAGAGGSARFFGLVARGRKFVYVVDRSSSMSGERLEDAKKELIRSIHDLPRFAEFYVFFYNNGHLGMPAPGLVRATPENKKQYTDWINTIQAAGGTDPTGALIGALDMKPDAIWLLSDGEFSDQAATALKAKNEGLHVQVHTIAFHSERGAKVLQRIARENDGRYRFVGSRDAQNSVRTRLYHR